MEDKNKTANLEIVIDDGSQRIPIRNMSGEEVGVFYFRPTDFAMIERYNETVAKFDEIVAPLESIDIGADGTVDVADDKSVEAMKEAETRLYEACDYIFGGNFAEAFFGKMHPFSPVGGAFYCESAIEKVGDFIAKQFDQETKKINKRMSKYIKKYGKGK